MALNGYRSAEDRATRLVMTRAGFVVAIRIKPQHYEIKQDGITFGFVTKFKHWYAERAGDKAFMGPMGSGSHWPQLTRQAAIEWLMKNSRQDAGAAPITLTPADRALADDIASVRKQPLEIQK